VRGDGQNVPSDGGTAIDNGDTPYACDHEYQDTRVRKIHNGANEVMKDLVVRSL
jgi:hypothetical protein